MITKENYINKHFLDNYSSDEMLKISRELFEVKENGKTDKFLDYIQDLILQTDNLTLYQMEENFKNAISNGRTNLLMYAVMRFGKTFTALCCAEEIKNLKTVLIVSAKGDVRSEWKKNVESHVKFENYVFVDKSNLAPDTISTALIQGKKLAIFLNIFNFVHSCLIFIIFHQYQRLIFFQM